MIYKISGRKVMLDFELAKIYGYETKNFNRQLKNNIEKFDAESRFQLTKNELNEVLRCKNFTSSWGGSRMLPYAFTIDGIKTLVTILKPKDDISKQNVLFLNEYINNIDNQIIQKQPSEAKNYDIVKFESGNVLLDVRVSPDEETIWLTQQEIAELFETSKQNISSHINKIYEEKELDFSSTVKEYLTVQIEGDRKINRTIRYYNLDVILSVGYRVNSKRGIEFRRWANNVLKNYLIKGYSINTKRCLEHSDIILKLNNDVNSLINQVSSNTNEIKEIKQKLDIVMDNFIDPNTYKHYLIKEGEKLEADIAYQSIYKLAKSSIYIIDDYIDVKTLQLLKCCNPNINIVIFSDNKAKNNLNSNYINDFINDTKFNISFKRNNKIFHSRYIIIDYKTDNEIIYLSGGSIKDGGNKINTIIKVEDKELYHPSIDKALNNNALRIN